MDGIHINLSYTAVYICRILFLFLCIFIFFLWRWFPNFIFFSVRFFFSVVTSLSHAAQLNGTTCICLFTCLEAESTPYVKYAPCPAGVQIRCMRSRPHVKYTYDVMYGRAQDDTLPIPRELYLHRDVEGHGKP